MNIIYNHKDIYNNKNYSENFKKFFSQEEIDKMSYNEKFFSPCKCGKKGEIRWLQCTDGDSKAGMFYATAPFRGKNGEEVCHKCAPCVKCGKENYGDFFAAPHVKTGDNPSGEWALAYCSFNCYNGTEKPSLPKKEPRKVESCNYCGKLTAVKFANSPTEKTFCSRDCYVAAGNKIQKGKCRIAGCSREAYYECMDLCLSHSKPCRGGKIKPNGKRCIAAMGVDEGDICEFCQNQTETYQQWNAELDNNNDKGNFPVPNPAVPASIITNSNDKSDNSVKVNPGNSPKPNPGKDNSFEIRISLNQGEPSRNEPKNNSGEKSQQNELTNRDNNNQALFINLKDIKKISLVGDNLVIKFNQSEQTQTVISEQITNNQELQAVKNYLRKNNQTSLSQQELSSIINANNASSVPAAKSKDNNNNGLVIGLSITTALAVGLAVGLLFKSKKKIKKN